VTTTTLNGRAAAARPATRSELQAERIRAARLFLLPMLAALILVAAWPLLRTIYFSFTNTSLTDLAGGEWIGFDNYLIADHFGASAAGGVAGAGSAPAGGVEPPGAATGGVEPVEGVQIGGSVAASWTLLAT
jgi:hypothetical protein